MGTFRWAVSVFLLAILSSAVLAQPASADEGDASTEGYVIVQQALSYLVNDTGPDAAAQALMKVDEALAAEDQEGVDVNQVRQAKSALEAGQFDEGRTLLQGSIAAALSVLGPATAEETGTSVVLGPQPRAALTGWAIGFLILSLLMAFTGIALAILFRPRQNLRDLRHVVRPHRAQ